MSVDDTSDDRGRTGDDETDTRADDGCARGDSPADDRPSSLAPADDRRPTPTALRATGPAVTIEFTRETGEIHIRRETALGTLTESVER